MSKGRLAIMDLFLNIKVLLQTSGAARCVLLITWLSGRRARCADGLAAPPDQPTWYALTIKAHYPPFNSSFTRLVIFS